MLARDQGIQELGSIGIFSWPLFWQPDPYIIGIAGPQSNPPWRRRFSKSFPNP